MKWAICLAAMLAAAGCGASDADKASAAKCIPNAGKLLALDFAAFDQDPSGGWRSVSAQAGCDGAVADLIARYRKSKGKSPEKAKMLEWHEAQARAMAGQTDRAVKILQQRPDEEKPDAQPYYDEPAALYRDATIAFLENDRAALEAARSKLAALPEPPDFTALKASFRKKFPTSAPPVWPMKLDAVDGLIACFGKPYKQAYGAECRPSSRQTQAAGAVRADR
jgi:hypothetical protein